MDTEMFGAMMCLVVIVFGLAVFSVAAIVFLRRLNHSTPPMTIPYKRGLAWSFLFLMLIGGGCWFYGFWNDRTLTSSIEFVPESFLTAMVNKDGGSAYGLLSNEYRDRLPEEEKKSKSLQTNVLGGKPIKRWAFKNTKSRAISPSRNRVMYSGIVTSNDTDELFKFEFGFTIHMVKQNDQWRIDLFTVGPQAWKTSLRDEYDR